MSLRAWCVLPPERSSGKRLYHLLNDWMGGLEWDSYSGKFLDKEGLGRWRKRNGASRRRKDLEQFASDIRRHMALIVMRKNPLRKLLEDIGIMAGGLAGKNVGYGRVPN